MHWQDNHGPMDIDTSMHESIKVINNGCSGKILNDASFIWMYINPNAYLKRNKCKDKAYFSCGPLLHAHQKIFTPARVMQSYGHQYFEPREQIIHAVTYLWVVVLLVLSVVRFDMHSSVWQIWQHLDLSKFRA